MTTDAAADESPTEAPDLPEGVCQGPCMEKVREAAAEGKEPKGTFRYGDPLVCSQCAYALRQGLAELDTTAAVLMASADGFRKSVGSDAAIRAHRNAGGQDPARDRALVNELDGDLRQFATAKRPVASRLGLVARSTTELASWLMENLNLFLYDENYAGPLAMSVHRWRGRLEAAAAAGQPLVNKPLPCPRCRLKGLQQERGSDIVKCSECGRIMNVTEYDELAAEADAQMVRSGGGHDEDHGEPAAAGSSRRKAARATAAPRRRAAGTGAAGGSGGDSGDPA
jgi:hypothetical protein